MVICLLFGVGLAVAYHHSIVAKVVLISCPRDDFQETIGPGIIVGIISLSSIVLQIIFRLFVHFNITNNSNNLLSLKSVIILFVSVFMNLLSIQLIPNFFVIVRFLSSILKFFALPLEILYNNEEAKNYFKHNNPKVLNVIPITIQSLQFLKDKTIQFISLLKIKLLGPSNQVAPLDIIELQDVL